MGDVNILLVVATAVLSMCMIFLVREGMLRQRLARQAGVVTGAGQPFSVDLHRQAVALQQTTEWRASMRRHFVAAFIAMPAAAVMAYAAYQMLVS